MSCLIFPKECLIFFSNNSANILLSFNQHLQNHVLWDHGKCPEENQMLKKSLNILQDICMCLWQQSRMKKDYSTTGRSNK